MRRTDLHIVIPPAGWVVAMLVVSSLPGQSLPDGISLWQWDKLAHIFEYCVLAVLSGRLLQWYRIAEPRQSLAILGCGTVFAALDEVHQLFIPNRSCAWQDLVADIAGIILGLIIFRIAIRKRMHDQVAHNK
ncbi:MAG: hypothetical protein GF398_12005 [Chitinivibrionales bacterium]|nr:hypothetical protein [Chitinivibrionales bacterium]